MNLVLKDSLLSFPSEITNIVEEVNLTFCKSPQRCAMLKEIINRKYQDEEINVIGVKRYVKTRWSSYLESLKRILRIKEALKEFFDTYGSSNQKKFFDNDNVIMLQLLESLMDSIHYYLKLFETEDANPTWVYDQLLNCQTNIGRLILKSETDMRSLDLSKK